MFRRFRSSQSVMENTEISNKVHVTGRFSETLQFNHFTSEDYENIREIGNYIYKRIEGELISNLSSLLNKIHKNNRLNISEQAIKSYFDHFFFSDRDEEYLKSSLQFFRLLREEKLPLSKLVSVFNQIQFIILSNILTSKSLSNKKKLPAIEALHHTFNIETQLLIEVFNESLIENVTDGIAALLEKNAEIIFIKDLVMNLDQQNVDIQTVTSAAEEMTSSIDDTANAANNVSEQTKYSVEKAENGRKIISHALDEIIQTGATFEEIVLKFEQLQGYLSTIEDVVVLINGIADQTNLLALNASIEAARAGEQGKGFSVVASEVKKLAEHTVQSLQQVNENVQNLNTFSKNVSELIQSTTKIINQATAEAKDSLPLLDDISNTIVEIHNGTVDTAAVIEEQAASIDEISQRMGSVANLTDNIRALGEETSKVIFELSQSINSFRLNMVDNQDIYLSTKALLNLSKSDHILWKWRIYNMFIGHEQIEEKDVSSHQDCRLGKWYFHSETQKRFAGSDIFKQLDVPHKVVHDSARNAVREFKLGNIQRAEEYLEQLNQASEEVLLILNKLSATVVH